MNFFNTKIKKLFIRSFLVLASGTFIAQLIQLVSYPFIARFFTPEDFGIKTLFTTALVLAGNFATGKYEQAVPIAKTDEAAIDVIVLTSLISLIAALFFSVFFYFFHHRLFDNHSPYDFYIYVILVPFGLIAMSLMNTIGQWSNRKSDFGIMSKVKMIQAFSKAVFEVGGGFFRMGGIILIIGTLIGMCGGLITYSIYLYNQIKELGLVLSKSFNKNRLTNVAKRFIDFPKYFIFSGMLNRLNNHLPVLFFSYYASIDIIGHYSMAVLFVSIPSAIFMESILKIFYTETAAYLRTDLSKVKPFFRYNFLLSTGISFIIALGFFLFGKPFVLFALGSQWELAGEMLKYYSWIIIASNWFFISFYVYTLLEKQKAFLWFNFFKMVFLLLGFFIALKTESTSEYVLLIYVNVLLIYSGFQLFVTYKSLNKYIEEKAIP